MDSSCVAEIETWQIPAAVTSGQSLGANGVMVRKGHRPARCVDHKRIVIKRLQIGLKSARKSLPRDERDRVTSICATDFRRSSNMLSNFAEDRANVLLSVVWSPLTHYPIGYKLRQARSLRILRTRLHQAKSSAGLSAFSNGLPNASAVKRWKN